MTIQIGICDDRVEDIKILSESLYAYDPTFKIFHYTDGESLIEDCRDAEIQFDILFMDIYMPGLNGIETARKIRARMKYVKIVFISSSSEHYPEAYDVFAFNYILKPFSKEKLNSVVNQALLEINREHRQRISFSYKGKRHCVYCQDILYIESRDKTISFYMENKRILQCYGKLDEILKQLPEELFIRCHQSFAVNVFHVTEMTNNYYRIDSVVISISKKYLKQSKDRYFAYLFTHMNRGL